MIKRIALRLLLFFGIFVLFLIANLVIFNRLASKVTEGEPIVNRDPDRVALLVVDIQEGTTGTASSNHAYIRQAESLIDQVNRLVEEGAGNGWAIVWIRSEVVNPFINMINNSLARGSVGAELDGRLNSSVGRVVVKHRNDAFNRTPLDSLLMEKEIGRLVIAGLDAEHCVLSAIRAAANRGYALTVFRETVIADEEDRMNEIFSLYEEMGVELRSMNK